HWKVLTETQRNCICYYQELTQDFITKYWKDLTEWQRYYVYEYQELSTSFREQIIDNKVPEVQTSQKLPTKTMRFIDMNFEDF
ncbi:hypothetical protein LCGC14_1170710, partial [marine sediment metagenome]